MEYYSVYTRGPTCADVERSPIDVTVIKIWELLIAPDVPGDEFKVDRAQTRPRYFPLDRVHALALFPVDTFSDARLVSYVTRRSLLTGDYLLTPARSIFCVFSLFRN